MRSEPEVREVFRLAGMGLSQAEIATATGVSRSHVTRLIAAGEDAILAAPSRSRRPCDSGAECEHVSNAPADRYAYLLGQYLGDGHIVRSRRTYRLEVFCCAAYPDIVTECAGAIASVLPTNRVGFRKQPGVVAVGCYSSHLPCLFPQHGPGLKHARPIVLAPWQQEIALRTHPHALLRGLIHSDGCRATNRVRNRSGKQYSYPRYFFSNRSLQIQQLFKDACDVVGVEWRQMNRWNLSVARRASVELLDTFIGPKS